MFSECEHACLLQMAIDCRDKGMSRPQAQQSIDLELHGFSSCFRISQAVETAYSPAPHPDLIFQG